MTSQLQRDLDACTRMCETLREKVLELRKKTSPKILSDIAGNPDVKEYEPKERNCCTGHFGKIYSLHWGPDSKHIVTASQDGKLIIWNSLTGNKQLAITLNSAWVMTCAFSLTYSYVGSGGLDNTVSIFRTTDKNTQQEGGGKFKSKELYRELEKHDGYISCARFIDDSDSEILSSSGDGTCILWDIETRTAKNIYMDHTNDVMFVSLNKTNPKLFASGSVDTTAKVWDMRQGERSIANFPGHQADINTVEWFPDGQCIVTGSDDGSVRLFDMRSYRQISEYLHEENISLHCQDPAGVTSVSCSSSGAYIFSAYDNGHVYMWSTLRGEYIVDLPHESRVSSLGVSPNGYGLATGCWDFNLRVFA